MKTISSLRISEKSFNNMAQAIKKYNSTAPFEINQAEFRRMAIEVLSQIIITGKDIPKSSLK